jgi:hypothetical protein
MASEILADLPDLPTREEWVRETRRWVHPRSDELKAFDRALDNYARLQRDYNAARTAVESTNVYMQADLSQPHRLFMDAANAFGQAAAAFQALDNAHQNWGEGHDSRNRKGALDDLRTRIEAGRDAIQQGRDRLQEATVELEAPKVIHMVWNGSEPREDVLRKAKIMEIVHPDHTINLWADKESLLANDFRRETAKLREGAGKFGPEDDPAITARMERWKNDPHLSEGLDVKLAGEPWAQEKLQQRRAALEHMSEVFAAPTSRTQLRDVGERWQEGREYVNAPEALTMDERRQLRAAYRFEAGQRCNFGASSDIARDVILHDEPGKYYDYDKSPPVKGFSGLIDAYNTAVDGYLRAQVSARGRPDNSAVRVPPDPQAMQANYNFLRNTFRDDSVPQPIDIARRGAQVLDAPGYRFLIGAAREHIDQFVPRPDGTLPAKQHDSHAALLEHVNQFDSTGRVQEAFKQWAGGVHSVQDGYEPIPAIRVSKLMFKMLELRPGGGAVINSVQATSTPAARGMTMVIRSKMERLEEMRQPENKRLYMDDSERNRRGNIDTTVLASGPGAVTNNEPLLQGLRDRCGAAGRGSDFMKVPYSHFPNPSLSELDTSWAPAAPKRPTSTEHSTGWVSAVGTAPITDFSDIHPTLVKLFEASGIRTPSVQRSEISREREQLPQRRAGEPSRSSEVSLDSEGQPKRGRALSR